MNGKQQLIIYFLTPWAVVTASAYLNGYWGKFNVQIHQYLSITEILIYALIPVLLGTIPFVWTSISTSIQDDQPDEPKPDEEKQPEVVDITRKERFTASIKKNKALLLLLAVGIWFGYSHGWLVGVIVVVMFFVVIPQLVRVEWMTALVPSLNWRITLVSCFVMVPFFAWTTGRSNADRIYENKRFEYALSNNFLDTDFVGPPERLKFLGKAGAYYFFVPERNEPLLIMPRSDVGTLMLYHCSEKKE